MSNPIRNGITYLANKQKEDGSFHNLSSPEAANFNNANFSQTTFFSSLILGALTSLPRKNEVKSISSHLVEFLLSQKSTLWTFNYWIKNSPQSKQMPYPDDLDDTFCALAALSVYDSSLIDGATFAKIVQVLTAVELKEGGPYNTWIINDVHKKPWHDCDIAVNSNVAYFLSLYDISLANVTVFIEKQIKDKKLTSPYYYSFYPLIYFISRWYRGKQKADLEEILLSKQKKNGSWDNPLQTALAITSLLNFGNTSKQLNKGIRYLRTMQTEKGCWDAYPFGLDPIVKGKIFYTGSPTLTTAFCLEALQKYENMQIVPTSSLEMESINSIEESLSQEVFFSVEERFSDLEKDLTTIALKRLSQLMASDNGKQIALLPYYFRESLGSNGNHISDELVYTLGRANTFGWLAYTIYDDFYDAEGSPHQLALANISMRELTKIFLENFVDKPHFHSVFQSVMDKIDQANAWEVLHCTFPVEQQLKKVPHYTHGYQQLADKSFGHALGPLSMLSFLGFDNHYPEYKNTESFFRHYLIAKQLNDDAHDWVKDLSLGRINPVGAMLLAAYIKKTNKPFPDFLSIKEELQELFWYSVIEDVCVLIRKNIASAREALADISILQYPEVLENILLPLELATQQASKQGNDTRLFITSYTK